MTEQILPPLPAIGNARIEILGLDEKLYNGSFEIVDDPNLQYPWPLGWGYWPNGGYKFSVERPDIATDGRRVMSIGVYETGFGAGHYIYHDTFLEVGARYRLHVAAGKEFGSTGYPLTVIVANVAGWAELVHLTIDNGFPLQSYVAEFTAPDQVRVQIGVPDAIGNPEFWMIDSVSLSKVDAQWVDVTPQSMVMQLGWGADDPAGLLTVPASGHWDVRTYDPERVLDPSNGASPHAQWLHPGRPMRIGVESPDTGYQVIRQGLIDEITYDVKDLQGTMRGTDIVPLIVAAKIPASETPDPNLPTTLRARARYLIDKAGLGIIVPVEADPQLVINHSFEQELFGWSTGQGIIYTEAVGIPEGQGFGQLHLTILSNSASYPQTKSTLFDVVPGKQYKLSAWAMSPVSGLLHDVIVRVDRENDSYTTMAQLIWNGPNMVLGQWTYKEALVTIPDGATRASVLAFIAADPASASEYIYFDLVSFTEVIPDPTVGPLPFDRDISVWSAIGTSAYDVLHAMWVDRLGVLRFRSFGEPRDNGFQIGGDTGIPIATLKTHASLQNIYTVVRAFDMDAPEVPVVKQSPRAINLYGVIPLTREKPVPDAEFWATNVLADRSGSALQYETGTLYPRTSAELRSLIELEMIENAHIVADDIEPTLDVTARVLGVRLTADTGTGWTGEVITYIPSSEWQDAALPPIVIEPEPPIPPATHQETRYYNATKDSRAARDSGGTNLGSGTEGELPVGAWQGWRNRAFLAFASINWTGVESVDQCLLELDTSSQVNVGFGDSPKVIVARCTEGWGEGSSSSPSGSNSLKYPGPSCTSTNQRTQTVTRSENASVGIDITAIARDWKAGLGTYGLRIISAGEDSNKYTTEFWSRENSDAAKRPRLKLVVTVANVEKPAP